MKRWQQGQTSQKGSMEEHNQNNMGDHRLEVVGVERRTLDD